MQNKVECDVVIIGSGAGGGVAAEIFSRSGLNVVILEEGPLKTASDFNMKEADAYAELYQEVAGRQTLDQAIQILQGRAVGGSTTVNWTSSFRTPEQTLSYWQSEFGVTALNKEKLAPWFDWAEKRLSISPWLVPPNRNNQLLADGAEQLGWSYQEIPRNVKGCANLGYCGTGCPLDAKQSMLVTCIPEALQRGARLFTRARANKLLRNNETVTQVEVVPMDSLGQAKTSGSFKVIAKHVVLAAGAIGSPGVLLRSGFSEINPLIGKRTFLHPVTASIAVMEQPVNGYQGAPQSIYSDQFLWRDGVSGELGYKLEVPPIHPVLASTLLKHHGEAHFELLKDFTHLQVNLALLRDGFNPDSRGGQVKLDKFSYPRLDYSISKSLWRGLKHAMLSMTENQFAAGAKAVMPLHMDAQKVSSWKAVKKQIENLPVEPVRWQIMSAHVMGGCGIGKQGKSVCDELGQVHGFDNLSVLDGSLFPTSLGVNPQLSIYAIVAKLAATLSVKLGGDLPEDLPTET